MFKLLRLSKQSKYKWKFGKPYPILDERFANSGSGKGHYFHQDLLIAQKIFFNKPNKHVDIGSRLDGFVSHVASFRNIEVLDIRKPPEKIQNILFFQGDIMSELSHDLINYCDSLSSLHAVEHFGLGRYNDPINYNGYIIGLENMYKILQAGGKFYFSVPIGSQRIEFNAHRVFCLTHLIELFKNKYFFDCFSYVDDNGDLHSNVELSENNIVNNFGCEYGCGIFEMTKK